MPTTAIMFGVLLILVGIIGYGYGMMNGAASLTAMIPAIFGILLALLGYLAKMKENLRKHLMHAAIVVALLGFLGTVSSFIKLPALFAGTAERPAAVAAQFATAVICLIFIILSVKSFIDARKNS